jgi:predicted ribosome quality control (RQC) complex YloA/Tae2 family protein
MSNQRQREISAIDLRFLEKEWELAGGFIRKVYHSPGSERLSLEIFVPQKGTLYLSVLPSWLSLDKTKLPSPEKPSGFCMFLRKHLSGKRIERLNQHGFERILEMEAGGLRLILEFVPPGNVILTDSQGIILGTLNTKKWRDREIRPKVMYQYPPERPNPFSMDIQKFSQFFMQDKRAASILASDLGLGPEYANRLCAFAGVRPDKSGRSLDEKEITSLLERLPRLERISGSPVVEEKDARQERLERIEIQRKEGLEKWKEAERKARDRADAIYRKFDTVDSLLEKFHSKKDTGFEPLQKVEGLHITANLDGVSVSLDLKKTAQENASFYYEQAKKAKRKLIGLEASMQKPIEEKVREEPQEYPNQDMHREWYQKFKWFHSSEGSLVVAGKSADQNEILLKNHAEPEEWCFHADVKGAAFTVIKSGNQNPSEQTKKEAAEFAAAQSKAWQKGFGSVHVFSVQRKGLSKTPPTGMFLPKGSFMVSGQRVWYRNLPLRLAIGANEKGEILSGPESAIKKASQYLVMIVPGDEKASDLSREMKSEFLKGGKQKDLDVFQRLSLDELARHVPSGSGQLERK